MKEESKTVKFYRHYKNKPYKYLGIVKHSETLEDLVLYECQYDNPTAKFWVRPKDMYFGTVNLKGQNQPRFAKVPIRIEPFTTLSEKEIATIAPLIEKVLGEWDPKWFHASVNNRKNYHLAVAWADDKPIGFKLGYELEPTCFYSFLGAVLPDYQGYGVATLLMQSQHQWAQDQGYQRIQTSTQNRYKAMLALNLKMGFEIIGTEAFALRGGLKIRLEKKLIPDGKLRTHSFGLDFHGLSLIARSEILAVAHLSPHDAIPAWASQSAFFSVVKTSEELSVVCLDSDVPEAVRAERGWRVIEVQGPLDFSQTGILASLTAPLAAQNISVFAISTFATDFVLVKTEAWEQALGTLRASGHQI